MNISLEQLGQIKTGSNQVEEQYISDRHLYLMGRAGYPEHPPQGFTEREAGCYMMGYNVSETLTN